MMTRLARVTAHLAEHGYLVDEYEAGATVTELADRHGIGRTTITTRLKKAGVTLRRRSRRGKPAHRATHVAIRQLADLLRDTSQTAVLAKAGLSARWWADARKGHRNPLLPAIEAFANAAGYELVLRRRVG